ncbi:MAG: ABC transporter permease [Clostridiales bacterium]
MKTRFRLSPAFWLALPTLLTLAVLFVAPMLWILVRTLQADGLSNFIKFLSDSFYRDILWNTLKISLQVTVISLLLGYPTAYFLARTPSRIKSILMIVVIFPFLVSAVVRSYGWMVILGNKGLLNQFLQAMGLVSAPLKIMNTPVAVIIGLVHLLVPYMILSITSVLQGIDRNVEYAAASLGANPVQTFFKVVFPLSTPGIIAGSILVFTLSMTSYVTPKLLGGARFRMMSTMVFQEINVNFNWGFASAISYILLFTILIMLLLYNYATAGIAKRVGGAKNG